MKKYVMTNQYIIAAVTLRRLYKLIVRYSRRFKTFELLSINPIQVNGKYEVVVFAK